MQRVTVAQAMQVALNHHQAGRLSEAQSIYQQILAQQPDHPGALHLLGTIAQQAGRHDLAVDLIRRAISFLPGDAAFHSNLGNSLTSLGKLDEAVAEFAKALQCQPDFAPAYFNLGNALEALGKPEEAAAAYSKAIAAKPDFAQAYNNLGIVLIQLGRRGEAVAAYAKAIELKPDYAQAHYNLGNTFTRLGNLTEAIASYQRAIRSRPQFSEAWNNMGSALADQEKLDEAIAAHLHAIQLDAKNASAWSNLGNARKDQGLPDEALACFEKGIALAPEDRILQSNRLYTLHLHPAYDAASIYREHRQWNERHAVRLRSSRSEPFKTLIAPHLNVADPDRRLRIGYVSPDFRIHPVGRMLLPLLESHDYPNFEIFCYSEVLAPDAITGRIRSLADNWRNIVDLSHDRAAEMVREDQIDILVDLAMHTANNRLPVFARKPSPVQVAYLAYCSTTGLDTIDYRLTDPYLDPFDAAQGGPPGKGDACYTEKSIRLPETFWCYEPGMATAAVGPLPAAAAGHITFGCLNVFAKVSADALATWRQILAQVPRSRVMLHAKEGIHRQRVLDLFQREGIDPSRIRFMGRLPGEQYFQLYQQIDIALDTFPCAGGATTCDAIWMGVPVITLTGRTAVGRSGVSILSNVGLAELVAQTHDQYLRLAVALAADLPRLAAMRAGLRARMQQSPLMDAPRFARNIEAAFRDMWHLYCAGGRV